MNESTPAISAIYFTLTDFEAIRRVVSAWSRQTAASNVEAILVCPDEATVGIEENLFANFRSWKVVECDRVDSSACMRVAGIRAASAPYIAITEDHCFPHKRWAELILAKLEEGYDAVCGSFRCANPRRTMSWSNLLVEYTTWMEPIEDLEPDFIAGHNSAYRVESLMKLDDELDKLFEAETALHWEMGRRFGARFAVEPAARHHHLNFEKVLPSLGIRFVAGWSFADGRRQSWGWPTRLLYAGGSPLIPLVRFFRLWPGIRRQRRAPQGLLLYFLVIQQLKADALGQLFG